MIIIPDPILKIAEKIADAVISSLVDRGMVAADSILQKPGRNPTKDAFASALARSIDKFKSNYADWYASLFDESFFQKEGEPILAEFLLSNKSPNSSELAERWAKTFIQTTPERAFKLKQECQPAAEAFLGILETELFAEESLRAIYDSRNIHKIADAQGRSLKGAGLEPSTPSSRNIYLQWLVKHNLYIDVRGTFQTQRQVKLRLNEIYITLRARPEESPNSADRRLLEEEMAQLERLSGLSAESREDRQDELFARLAKSSRNQPISNTPVNLDEVVQEKPRLVILGDPGSGKTTLLSHLALTHAEALLNGTALVQTKPQAESAVSHVQPLFPIFLRIAAYAEFEDWKKTSLSNFLPQYFQANDCGAQGIADLFEKELDAGGCLVLLDGLDEIVDAGDRRAIVDKIENFVRRYDAGGKRGENRFVITSRIAGYRSAPVAGGSAPFAHFEVLDMDVPEIERFVNRWCNAMEDSQTPDLPAEQRKETAQREIDGILEAVKGNPGVRRLAANPLLLRILALIHHNGAQLPQRRIELYKLAAETLARTWRPANFVSVGEEVSKLLDDAYLTRLLGKLAYWMHLNKPTGLATEDEVLQHLGAEWAVILGKSWDEEQPDPSILNEVKKFLLAVREHTGIFVERAPKRYGFMHLTFEEYYAARFLVLRSKSRAKLIRQHLHDARWEEPILLALGFVGLDSPDDAAELVETAILAEGEDAIAFGFTPSLYEELLGRDYLFTLRCLGDRILMRPHIMSKLVDRIHKELIHPTGIALFQNHQRLLDERIGTLKGSDAALPLAKRLMNELRNADSDVRSRAAKSLGQLGSGTLAVVEGLLAALKDPDRYARLRAAESLGQLGSGTPAVVEGLLAALKDTERDVRLLAAECLGQLGSGTPAVVEGVLAALKDTDRGVRNRAAAILGQLGSGTPVVVEGLVAALKDTDSDVRLHAAESLGQLGSDTPMVVGGLLAALKDENVNVRLRAAESLVQFGSVTPAGVEGLLVALKDIDRYVGLRAAAILVQLGSGTLGLVEGLLAMLKDADRYARGCAAESLGQLGSGAPAVVEGLLAALKDADRGVRTRAVESLGHLGSSTPVVVGGLLAALKDADRGVRTRAAESLGHLGRGTPVVVEGLLAALKDTDRGVRIRAAESLGHLGSSTPAVVGGLLAALEDENVNVRLCAAESLVQLGSGTPTVVESLLVALKDTERDARLRAAENLGQLGSGMPAVVDGLLAALKDENVNVRLRAAESLGQLDAISPKLFPVWLQALRTADSRDIRQNCARLLGEYGNNDLKLIAALLNGLLDKDNVVRSTCSAAFARISKRLPETKVTIIEHLKIAISDKKYLEKDEFSERTGQDYAHQALWQVVSG